MRFEERLLMHHLPLSVVTSKDLLPSIRAGLHCIIGAGDNLYFMVGDLAAALHIDPAGCTITYYSQGKEVEPAVGGSTVEKVTK